MFNFSGLSYNVHAYKQFSKRLEIIFYLKIEDGGQEGGRQ